jgi:hypothetical protein
MNFTELLKPVRDLLTTLLPYLTVMFSVCLLILSTLNSYTSCTLKQEYVSYLNTTVPFFADKIAGQDYGNVYIAMSSILAALSLVFSLNGGKKDKKILSLESEKINLNEKLETLTLSNWRPSIAAGREPFNYSNEPSPVESVKTAYPAAIVIPDEREET